MNKRIIFHLIFAIIFAVGYYLLVDGADILEAVMFVVVYLVFSILLEFVRHKTRKKAEQIRSTVADNEKVKALIEALGGSENIVSADSESSRVKIAIRDIDLIDQDKLKEVALDGAYLSGNQLQLTIGANSYDFSHQIRDAIS